MLFVVLLVLFFLTLAWFYLKNHYDFWERRGFSFMFSTSTGSTAALTI